MLPWNQVGLGKVPFVRVFRSVGIPAAGHVMNFVVLTRGAFEREVQFVFHFAVVFFAGARRLRAGERWES